MRHIGYKRKKTPTQDPCFFKRQKIGVSEEKDMLKGNTKTGSPTEKVIYYITPAHT